MLTNANQQIESFTGALLTDNLELKRQIVGLWPEELAAWRFYDTGTVALESILESLPDILVSSMTLPDLPGVQVIDLVKGENVYRKIPAILCLDRTEFSPSLNLLMNQVDDFILTPVSGDELKTRIELGIMRSYRSMDANPLTHLPGNTSIIRYLQNRLDRGESFAMAYCDLDFFKSFNDNYGFSRGDEVLMMTARVILNTVHQLARRESFVGHVGGDDFVFVAPSELAEQACKDVISAFDAIIPQFYDLDDRRRKGIISYDRQGIMRNFPIMSLSIGVVFNHNGSLSHYGQASQLAMNLKKKAKEIPQSSYILDRRRPQ